MKKAAVVCCIIIFAAEIIALIFFAVHTPDSSLDAVAVNEVLQSVTADFSNIESHENGTELDYVVLDGVGKTVFKTQSGLSEDINEAIRRRDTILDVNINGATVGKIIIANNGEFLLRLQKRTALIIIAVALVFQCAICIIYAIYLNLTVIKPFRKLKAFAERVAGGNLDIPLEMDKYNVFGAFTESFDLMRSELKKARLSEAMAQQSKKELVAKLSHDIKTPVASIIAVAEVGAAISDNVKDSKRYSQIMLKATQIDTLVSNLFTATLEELQQLSVLPTEFNSKDLKILLENSDYLNLAEIPDVPDCLIRADKLRLQQVFDNIFANSYKYAKTKISVAVRCGDDGLSIAIEDYGGGVNAEELPYLKEKYKRGSNADETEGVGLGLFISDYFMREMQGSLIITNGEHGLKVTVTVPLCAVN